MLAHCQGLPYAPAASTWNASVSRQVAHMAMWQRALIPKHERVALLQVLTDAVHGGMM